MYKIAICDDDKRYRKTIREIVEHENSLPENEIRFYEYESGNELLKHTDILHELVFIDIRMPGLDGNQTALKLRNYNKDGVLIFCSSYFEPTVDSINFGQPFRYIHDLRNLDRNRYENVLQDLRNRLSHEKMDIQNGVNIHLECVLLPFGKSKLFLDADLMVADVASIHILIKELTRAYNGEKIHKYDRDIFKKYLLENDLVAWIKRIILYIKLKQ